MAPRLPPTGVSDTCVMELRVAHGRNGRWRRHLDDSQGGGGDGVGEVSAAGMVGAISGGGDVADAALLLPCAGAGVASGGGSTAWEVTSCGSAALAFGVGVGTAVKNCGTSFENRCFAWSP